MSDGSQSRPQRPVRPLRSDEKELVRALMSGVYPERETDLKIARALVQDMADGGMGSIRFVKADSDDRRFGKAIAEAESLDRDGVPVSITVNLDKNGDLFEIDLWKVDFTPLVGYPRPEDLTKSAASPTASAEATMVSHL